MNQKEIPRSNQSGRQTVRYLLIAICLLTGIFLRLPSSIFVGGPALVTALHPQPGFTGLGFDEGLYRNYTQTLIKVGVGEYPAIVDRYIELQKQLTGSVLPPVRFLYIFAAYLWHGIFGTEALAALHNVASFFSILLLTLATLFAYRMKGPTFALGLCALMSFAPTQIHMSQHALVDGFFAFWALLTLWLFWENLRPARGWPWLAAYLASLALLVLTKENSFFVWFALVALMVANRWLAFGSVKRELVLATLVGPFIGFVILIFLAGGIPTLLETYRLSVGKNYHLQYAILTGDGPWYRYLVDLLLASPLVLLLALGAAFRVKRGQREELFFIVFVAASYLVMCNLKYGMNLRYANMWDMPLRFLALSQLLALSSLLGRYRRAAISLAVAGISFLELRQYYLLFVQFPLYELVTEGLLRALHILKTR